VDEDAVVPSDAGTIGPDPLQLLLEVQAHDLALDRLAYRHRELPERARLKELEGWRADLERRLTDVEVRQAQLAKEQEQLEEHVQALLSRISVIEARLRAGAAGSFRDQQAMAVETESLDRQRRSTEDRELEIMEQLEPVESELTAVREELGQIDAERAKLSATVDQAESFIETERRAVLLERAALAASLPDALASSYERLRSKLGGIGAAKLVDGTCDGCHLKLPNRERDLIVHSPAGTIFYCDQCGRILVP
jgi:predicted  nucleic acid-binding Zn-ribbon protein